MTDSPVVEGWLTVVSADAPAGPDLSYDPARQEIEAAFEAAPDQADWDRTIALIRDQAAVTRDIWLPIYLMRAGARNADLATVEEGAALLAGLFERFWDTMHPTIEEYGLEGRKGACESLVRVGEFLAPLRRIPLLSHPRLGQFSGADVERFTAGGAGEDGYGPFRAAIADTPVEQMDAVADRLVSLRAAIRRADAVLSDQAAAAGQTGTNFSPTYEAIDAITHALAPYTTRASDKPDTAAAAAPVVPAIGSGDGSATPATVAGEIGSREEVARALDAIGRYYARHEPSSPVPIALDRVKGWITMDFMAILKDVAPGSIAEAATVLRARNDDDGAASDLM